jgi:hypothetical protein
MAQALKVNRIKVICKGLKNPFLPGSLITNQEVFNNFSDGGRLKKVFL